MPLTNIWLNSQLGTSKLPNNKVYLICECGDNFPTEADYEVHQEKVHGIMNTPKVIIQKQNSLEDNFTYIEVCPEVEGTPLQQPVYGNDWEKDPDYAVEYIIKCEDDILPSGQQDDHIKEESMSTGEEYPVKLAEGIEESKEGYQTVVTFRDRLKREHNYGKQHREQEFFCEICGQSFSSPRSVHQHAARVHAAEWHAGRVQRRTPSAPPKRFPCEICLKTYQTRAALQYHLYTHTGERPYECPMCPKRFTTPMYLQLHVRSHTGERPCVCLHCPKAFAGRAALQRHERVHTGEKPYTCGECGKAFTQSNSVKLHIRTVHRRLPAPYKRKARKQKAGRATEKLKVVKSEQADEFSDEYTVHNLVWPKSTRVIDQH